MKVTYVNKYYIAKLCEILNEKKNNYEKKISYNNIISFRRIFSYCFIFQEIVKCFLLQSEKHRILKKKSVLIKQLIKRVGNCNVV